MFNTRLEFINELLKYNEENNLNILNIKNLNYPKLYAMYLKDKDIKDLTDNKKIIKIFIKKNIH